LSASQLQCGAVNLSVDYHCVLHNQDMQLVLLYIYISFSAHVLPAEMTVSLITKDSGCDIFILYS